MEESFKPTGNAPRLIQVMASLLLALAMAPRALADDPTLPTIPDANTLLPASAVGAFVKTLGNLTSHRAYSGAESLSSANSSGFDYGIEATAMHLPDDFGESMESMGMGGGGSALPALPMAKLHLAKGLGPYIDVGFSGLYIPGGSVALLGFDAKWLFYAPEEGPHFAIRLNYSTTTLDFSRLKLPKLPIKVDGVDLGSASLIIRTRAISPNLVMSKRLNFAEPYLGVAMSFVEGQIDIPVNINVLGSTQTLTTGTQLSRSYSAFTGVSFRVPYAGLHLVTEGSYNTAGMHTFGLTLGMGF